MTDLPKLTLGEFQTMMDTLKTENEKTEPTYGFKPVPRKTFIPASRRCGCECTGCTDPDSNAKHCLESPCKRQRNRRSRKEIEASDIPRLASGRPRAEGVTPKTGSTPRVRTAAEVEAAGRYPNGRPKPDRSGWTKAGKPPPPADSKPDPLRRIVEWHVSARRNQTDLTLAAPEGRDEAYTMAGNLFLAGWTVQVLEP